jgi:Na+:H+ antiporter, NhaA family
MMKIPRKYRMVPLRLSRYFNEFFENEKAAGMVLFAVTIVSLTLANSPLQEDYTAFWQMPLGSHTLVQWINDGLMAIFFLLIGLELEREVYEGELSNLKSASLPFFGALGGMLFPALIYVLFNLGTSTIGGSGIPTATDIAFAVGLLAILGSKVPASLKVFLVALAIVDDLAAIIIISVFYTDTIHMNFLISALAVFVLLLVFNRMKIKSLIVYLIGGVAMWYLMLNSGVHATIAGVLLAFAIPFGKNGEKSPSYNLQHFLHKPVAFFVLPLFAIANSGFSIEGSLAETLSQPYSLGIIFGLALGKPLGIWLMSYLGVISKLCKLPEDLEWKNILGVGLLGGIGFTMSIFIALLAFDDPAIINGSKIAVLTASIISGISGFMLLKFTLKKPLN